MDISSLSPTERRILQFVAANPAASRTEIAKQLRLSRPHVSTLMNRRALKTAIEKIQRQQIAENGRMLTGATALALAALLDILKNPRASANERIRAATAILHHTAHAPEPPPEPERYRVWIAEDGVIHKDKDADGEWVPSS